MLERLERIFSALNVVYTLLLNNHIQVPACADCQLPPWTCLIHWRSGNQTCVLPATWNKELVKEHTTSTRTPSLETCA